MKLLRPSSLALLCGAASALALAVLAASALVRERAWRGERALADQEQLAREAVAAIEARVLAFESAAADAEDEAALDWSARGARLERLVPRGTWVALEQRERELPPRELAPAPAQEDEELFARVEEALRRGASASAAEAAEWARSAWQGIAHPGLKAEAALVRARVLQRSGDAAGAAAARAEALRGPLGFTRALPAPAAFLAAFEGWRSGAFSGPEALAAAEVALRELLVRAEREALEPGLLRGLAAELAERGSALAELASAAAERSARVRALEELALEGDTRAARRAGAWILLRFPRRARVRWALALPKEELAPPALFETLARATREVVTLLERSTSLRADARREALPSPLDDLELELRWTPRREEGGGNELALLCALVLASAVGLGAALRLARREQQLAARQAEFTGNVAHELRTPLAAVLLHAELLESASGAAPERRAEHLAVLQREGRRLASLVDRVVALAAGRRPAQAPTLALGELLERTLDHAGEDAVLRTKAPLELRLPDGEGALSALRELVDNARRHGAPPIELEAELLPANDRGVRILELRVLDRGSGVSERDRERIFERFARGEAATRDERRGAGLGLSLVRRFAEECGGGVASLAREGGGACFALRLPVKLAEGAPKTERER
ncbi:MAG: HAMP domain-containing histidine kinase [Planctomycetes bacterium]|nr:HAMP domain-containing histidine kinase [Planctomycetota bacterium]